jgi:hypothetical protein
MKKVLGIALFIAAVGMLAASCTPHKQACAAYSKVDIEASVAD